MIRLDEVSPHGDGSNMAASTSLDQLITKHAAELAEHVRAVAAVADKEEEIRIEVEKQLAFLQKAAGITLKGRHEFTVASGRADSVYQRVIIEYKNPSSAARIGDTLDSPGSRKLVEQIKNRFRDLQTEDGHPIERLFGVGCDGNRFIFVRWRDKKWDIQPPVEVNRHTAERFLWALFNLGEKGKAFRPEYLAADFGSNEGSIALRGIPILYDAIRKAKSPKAKTFFDQWKILFGEVCGYDVDNPSDKIRKLAKSYGITKDIHPAELLFAVHTYYAIFMKLLAGGVVAKFHKLPDPVSKLHHAATPAKFKDEMEELEKGSIFRHFNITNFLEGDLFAWYLPEWSDEIYGFLKGIVSKFDDYNPQTLAEEPNVSRDLLKKLYQELFPKSVRHDLGEYYTPDWLAEHVLNGVGYEGDPDKRILDPACGSGTFLVLAINRIRQWYENNRELPGVGYEEDELARKILANCIGFDLNPLAVMAARTNYLIAIRGLIDRLDRIEIPVYLCDSILTPSTYGGLFAGETDAAKELKTAAAKFLVPVEIAQSAADVARYAEVLEQCVKNHYSPAEFIERCTAEGLPVSKQTLHTDLYKQLVALDKANNNGVWARIIKNSFAPLFIGRVDFIAGNPPWVFWHHLPADYREDIRQLMTEEYRIMAGGQSTMKQLGSASKDLSMLFVYVGMHQYLSPEGCLGFVITQTLFQTTAGNEFRRFDLPNGGHFACTRVDDFVAVQPFRKSAGNKTAVMYATKGSKTEYPIAYNVYSAARDFDREDASLAHALECCEVATSEAQLSTAGDRSSFWVVTEEGTERRGFPESMRLKEQARVGINSNLESAFRAEIIKVQRGKRVLVRNVIKNAKRPLPQLEGVIEDSLLLPYMTGRSLGRWDARPAGYYIVPHTAESGMKPIAESVMRTKYPLTYAFLRNFKTDLENRPLHKRWGKDHPFYSLYNIGPYTFAPYKVVWKRTTRDFAAAVAATVDDEQLGSRLLVPNGKVMSLAFDDADCAYFVCGLLNAPTAREQINRAITGEAHRDIIKVVPVLEFDESDALHQEIASMSRKLHTFANAERVQKREKELDSLVMKLWKGG